jgi:hypothetical protein
MIARRFISPPSSVFLALATIAAAALAACSSSSGGDEGPRTPAEGHAFLTIVGAADVFVDGALGQALTVQYHDDEGHPLTGTIAFDIVGDPRGGDLSATTATTDAEGLAHIDVLPGQETRFQVTAAATYATDVAWNVAVGPGGSALDATGSYRLESSFDLADGVPGPVGAVVNAIFDMTDDPTDPATWVIDQLLAQVNSTTVTNAIGSLRPGLDVALNEALLHATPGFVATIVNVGDDLGQVARRFGSVSTLTVGDDPDTGLVASHAFDAFRFSVEGQDFEYSMSELELEASRAERVKVTLRGRTRLSLARHELPVAYGHLMVFVLDHAIIPSIVPTAHNLGELLTGLIDCAQVGQLLATRIGGPPLVYEIACKAGLTVGGALIEQQLDGVAAEATLGIEGDARPQSGSGGNDGKIDRLDFGEWEGALTFPAGATALSRPKQTWTGERQEP